MEEEGISLGWNCGPAITAVELGLRKKKEDGYKTCPFDLCVTNYIGVCKCLEDDFKYFCDINYLVLRLEPPMKELLGENQTEGQFWIYNTYYNFAFNHESPGHGNLYISEGWENGMHHFTENKFEKFIERYTRRIENFRNYIKSGSKINFVLLRYNSIPHKLSTIIQHKYPELDFTIYNIINMSQSTIESTKEKTQEGAINFALAYLQYLHVDNEDDEYDRFRKPLALDYFEHFNNDNDLRIRNIMNMI